MTQPNFLQPWLLASRESWRAPGVYSTIPGPRFADPQLQETAVDPKLPARELGESTQMHEIRVTMNVFRWRAHNVKYMLIAAAHCRCSSLAAALLSCVKSLLPVALDQRIFGGIDNPSPGLSQNAL